MNKHHAPFEPIAFRDPASMLGTLPAANAAELLGALGDVAFVIDDNGVIVDVAIGSAEMLTAGLDRWVGRSWRATVTVDGEPKIDEMLADARGGVRPRWRQVNHPAEDGELPMRYFVSALPSTGKIIAIGRDVRAMAAMQQRLLQAQQSLERDYLKMRQAEARYRMMFDMASEAVLIVDATNRRIRDANPAAYRLLGAKAGTLSDQPVSGLIVPDQRETLVAHLGAAEASDEVPPVAVRLAQGARDVVITTRLFRQARQSLLIVRIGDSASNDARHVHDAALSDVVEQMPDAFVLADADLTILTANTAFAELAEVATVDRLRGEKLGNWLGRPGIDLDLMVGQLREHSMVRNVSAVMRGSSGAQEEIEVSAVVAPSRGGDYYGFMIRCVARRLRPTPTNERDLPRSVEQLTELVGRMSMKEIVRESTDLIERLCIEAALAFTSDNRASAAEVLGLSRQSLYSKMHRHGLGNLVGDDD